MFTRALLRSSRITSTSQQFFRTSTQSRPYGTESNDENPDIIEGTPEDEKPIPKQLGTDERYSKADNSEIIEEKENQEDGDVPTEDLGQDDFKRKSHATSPRTKA